MSTFELSCDLAHKEFFDLKESLDNWKDGVQQESVKFDGKLIAF
jgi:hypothetical protein